MKLGNLYNLESFESFKDSHKAAGFTDAQGGLIIAENLKAIDPRIFTKRYPDTVMVNSGIQVSNTGGYNALIQSRRKSAVGSFVNANDAADNKGKITINGEQSLLKVIERQAHSKWTDTEIKQCNLEGINLQSEFVSGHQSVYVREVDLIGLTGGDTGNEGLLNYSGFASDTASGAAGTLSGEQLYKEISDLITAQHEGVLNTEGYMANKVLMPPRVMNQARKEILNSAGSSETVMEALRSNFPDVEFMSSFRCEKDADGGNAGATSVVVAFSVGEDSMIMRVPLPLLIGEIIKLNSFDYQVDSKYRIGGLDVLEDASGRILKGL